uniref:Tripartite motif-containing protein 16-like n=1 Tax=Sander lucioperca TaxID=283035 RepID=A0A8C9ZXR6_SANLU
LVQLDRETFSCSICLDLLKDPVTIPCGHSYCMDCIKRPVLLKNPMLTIVAKELKKNGLQAAPADHCYAGPEYVACDVCTGRKLKALKSCLVCLVSFCDQHLQPHYDSSAFEKHKLVEPSKNLQENICSRHDEVKKMFCRTDQKCICYLCTLDEHKGHDTVSAAAERTERQKELEVSQQNIQRRIQDREKNVKLLQQEVKAVNRSADKAMEDCGKIFTELIRLLEKRSSGVKQTVRSHQKTELSRVKEIQEKLEQEITELKGNQQNIQQRIQDREKDVKLLKQEVEAINRSADEVLEDNRKRFTKLIGLMEKRRSDVEQQVRSEQKTEVSRVKELQEKLEQEITELKRKDAELKKISDTEDHTQFLHNYSSLSPLSEFTDSKDKDKGKDLCPLRFFEEVTAATSEFRDNLQVDGLLPQPESKIRADFLKYSCEITMDPNTVNRHLLLSQGNRKATLLIEEQSYSRHPERFTDCRQVLSRESLTGRCYWEVEWTGRGVHVAVAYKNISREGSSGQCGFGLNDKSWALDCNRKSFLYNKVQTPVSGPLSSKLGVYLDHSAGTLSFYSVSETMTLLHTVQTTFTQPLYAGLWFLSCGTTAKFCKLK